LSISDRREYILQLNKMYKDCCGGLLEMVKVV
jgi:hypothetical protein